MWSPDSSKFDDHQFSAVKGRSTTHELVNILHICHQAADNQKITRAAFVDIAKAFDHVDHQIVLNKMAALGVQPFIIRWMHLFLLKRRQRVKINIIASNWATLNGGMPLDTWLGPYIFLIHINDLSRQRCLRSNSLTTSPWLKWLTVSQAVKCRLTSVDEIVKWSTDNHMNINTSKTKEMITDFARSSQSIVTDITTADNCPIERVSSFKLLGITLSNDLRWSCHVREISAKANKRLHFFKLMKCSTMTTDDLLHYYKTVIWSVIE